MQPAIAQSRRTAKSLTTPDVKRLASARKTLSHCGDAGKRLLANTEAVWTAYSDTRDRHIELRRELGAPIPTADTIVLVYLQGGDLGTLDYSVVLERNDDGMWHGSAVGKRQAWIPSPPSIEPLRRWTLPVADGRRLDTILADKCYYAEPTGFRSLTPPQVGAVGVDIETISRKKTRIASVYRGQGDELTDAVVTLADPR
ncbi:MAG: hypothetical protein ACRYFW_01670 [Janthinobacterium lividum]